MRSSERRHFAWLRRDGSVATGRLVTAVVGFGSLGPESSPDTMGTTAIPIQRSRPIYGLAVGLVIGIGLLWRSGLVALPNFIAKFGGDSLWALVVFLCFGFVSPRTSTVRIGFLAVCFAWSVEFLQLYHAHWIEVIRSTRLGRVVLGATFNSPDLLAYAVGIALGALAERAYLNEGKKTNQRA
jgi:hypothetical protein